jgi:hypothetical protein
MWTTVIAVPQESHRFSHNSLVTLKESGDAYVTISSMALILSKGPHFFRVHQISSLSPPFSENKNIKKQATVMSYSNDFASAFKKQKFTNH